MTAVGVTAQVAGAAPSSPGAAVVVSAQGVVRRYRNGRGVGPLDLEVMAGETLALMGRNGSGKTTLLRLLATVSRPDRGALRWFGAGPAAGRAALGLAVDSALEDPGLTGRQATHFWCAQWTRDRDQVAARADAALRRLGLAKAADQPVASYSFGMRRRLALAAALAHEPALALLDEPTAGLDPEGAGQLGALLGDRAASGHSTVVASNDVAFVEAVADRVAFLDEGSLLRCAPPAELLEGLPQGRVAELVLAGPCDTASLRRVAGVVDASAAGDTVTVRFLGDSTVAALVAAADAPGGRLRELRLRRPDLGDCFAGLAGRPLEERDAG